MLHDLSATSPDPVRPLQTSSDLVRMAFSTGPDQSRFHQLPAEIRLRIYVFVFDHEVVHLVRLRRRLFSLYCPAKLEDPQCALPRAQAQRIVDPTKLIFAGEFCGHFHHRDFSPSGHMVLSLPLTCRLFCNETLPILYEHSAFSVASYDVLEELSRLISEPKPFAGGFLSLRRLRLSFPNSPDPTDFARSIGSSSHAVEPCIRSLAQHALALRDLRVSLNLSNLRWPGDEYGDLILPTSIILALGQFRELEVFAIDPRHFASVGSRPLELLDGDLLESLRGNECLAVSATEQILREFVYSPRDYILSARDFKTLFMDKYLTLWKASAAMPGTS